jgi:hypothetical protein
MGYKWLGLFFNNLLVISLMMTFAQETNFKINKLELNSLIKNDQLIIMDSEALGEKHLIFCTRKDKFKEKGLLEEWYILLLSSDYNLLDTVISKNDSSNPNYYYDHNSFTIALKNSITYLASIITVDGNEDSFIIVDTKDRYVGSLLRVNNTVYYSTEFEDDTIRRIQLNNRTIHRLYYNMPNAEFFLTNDLILLFYSGKYYKIDNGNIEPTQTSEIKRNESILFLNRTNTEQYSSLLNKIKLE